MSRRKPITMGDLLSNGVEVRLLVASSGSQAAYATLVAQQIVQLAKVDYTLRRRDGLAI